MNQYFPTMMDRLFIGIRRLPVIRQIPSRAHGISVVVISHVLPHPVIGRAVSEILPVL